MFLNICNKPTIVSVTIFNNINCSKVVKPLLKSKHIFSADWNDTKMHKPTNQADHRYHKRMANPPRVIILKVPWNENILIQDVCIVLLSVKAKFAQRSPFFVHVNSKKNWSIKLTKTRGSNMGQRCVGVCGSCPFATFPTLSAALFAFKGSDQAT